MLEAPIFQILPNNKVRLIKDWRVTVRQIIPEGFESDLGSVPRSFWWFIHPNDITYSSIIHDYEWLLADLGKANYCDGNFNFLRNSVDFDGIPYWKALICFIVLEIIRIYKSIKYCHE
jgi:hypothetical protein